MEPGVARQVDLDAVNNPACVQHQPGLGDCLVAIQPHRRPACAWRQLDLALNELVDRKEYNQAKAQQMLSDAGVTGTTIKYAHTTGRFLNDRQIGQTLGQQLQKIGFSVNLEAPEWGTMFQRILDSQYDIWFAAYGTLTLDPDYAMNWLYNSQTSWNKYSNPKVDQLLQTGDQAFDNASATYSDLQSTVWQDAPNNWLYFQPELHGVSKKLRNHQPRPDEYWLFKDVYLEK